MKLDIEINDLAKARIKADALAKIVKKTIEYSGFNFLKNKTVSVSFAIVNEKEIRRLNNLYRKIDAVTDILSFTEYKNSADIKKEKESSIFLGELVLCYNDIEKFAKKNKISVKEEFNNVVSHGSLHLLGFRHGKKMFAIQKKVKL
ncbi:MAG TPA: rRNA maturation RNase YbeY [Patescibacteria group bacterium]|nr:rRNA maturation RNase YbeY [Patescibacteria group bacterium]